MPTLPLRDYRLGPDLLVSDGASGTLRVPRTRLHCLLEVPGWLLPCEAVIDTGAPLCIFPESVWLHFQPGLDYELLPFVGANPPAVRIASWQFTFRLARFLVPLALCDVGLTTRVERPNVIAQFANGDPPGWRSTPPVVIGLWGGLLEGGRIGIDRDPHTGRATGELVFP